MKGTNGSVVVNKVIYFDSVMRNLIQLTRTACTDSEGSKDKTPQALRTGTVISQGAAIVTGYKHKDETTNQRRATLKKLLEQDWRDYAKWRKYHEKIKSKLQMIQYISVYMTRH